MVVTSALGCVMPYSEQAFHKIRKAPGSEERALNWTDEGALGLQGFDWGARACGPQDSGMRSVTVTREVVTHRWFTVGEVPTTCVLAS